MKKNQYSRKKEAVFIASALSSIISTAVSNPLEVAKLNIQFFPLSCEFYPHQSTRQLSNCECSRFSIQGSLNSLKVALPQVLFSNIVYMQIYEKLRQQCINNTNLGPVMSTLTASIAGRTIVTTANVPIQSLRIRISNEVKSKQINFHGLKVTLARDIIYSGTFWSLLQYYRNLSFKGQYRANVKNIQEFSWKNFTSNLMPGFVFTGLVSALTTPLDTLKTRVQSKGIKDYKILQGITSIYEKEGITGLFAGMKWRMLKNSVHTSLYLFTYEWLIQKIRFNDAYCTQVQQ